MDDKVICRTRLARTSDFVGQPATVTGEPADSMAGVIDAHPTSHSSNRRQYQFSLRTLCVVLLCAAGLLGVAAQFGIGVAVLAPAVIGFGLSRSPHAGTVTVFCLSILIPISLLLLFLLFGT